MNAVNVSPLRLVFATEHDAVEVLCLNAQYTAGCQNRMIYFRKTAVGAGQDKVVKNIWAAPGQRSANSKLTNLAVNEMGNMVGYRAKCQSQQHCAGDCEREHRRADACNTGLHAAVSRQR